MGDNSCLIEMILDFHADMHDMHRTHSCSMCMSSYSSSSSPLDPLQIIDQKITSTPCAQSHFTQLSGKCYVYMKDRSHAVCLLDTVRNGNQLYHEQTRGSIRDSIYTTGDRSRRDTGDGWCISEDYLVIQSYLPLTDTYVHVS